MADISLDYLFLEKILLLKYLYRTAIPNKSVKFEWEASKTFDIYLYFKNKS